MKINTSRFGEVEIDDSSVITFIKGIPGFPDEKRYVLLPHREDSPFMWLQSIDNPELAFLVINPFEINQDYAYEIPDQVQEELKISDPEQVQTLAMVTVRKEGEKPVITVNLLGPLVINIEEMVASQLVLDPKQYDVQHRLS